MKISICIPVMSRPRQFFEAVCSILVQGYENLELVVQDGDPEHPVAGDLRVAGALSLLGSRAKYVASRDTGIFPALNACLCRATGDILYFMCSDDLLVPGALAAVNAVFAGDRFGGPLWLYGRTISADATGRKQGVDGKLVTRDDMLLYNRLGQPAVFWNRQLMDLAGKFDERYRWAADYDLWLRFWRRVEPVLLDQELGVFRHHGDNSSQVHATELEAECEKIRARHRSLSDVLVRSRNRLVACQAYGKEPAEERG